MGKHILRVVKVVSKMALASIAVISLLTACSKSDEPSANGKNQKGIFEYAITGGISKNIKGTEAEFFVDNGHFYLILNEASDHLSIQVYTAPIAETSYLMQSEGNANVQTGSIFTSDFHSFITNFQTGGSVSLSSVKENVIIGSFNLLMDDNSPTAAITVNVSGTFTAIKRAD